MLPRPRFRLPLWVAFAIVILAYLGRSALRGLDFRPDMPIDAIVGVLFLVVVGIVGYVRRVISREEDSDENESSGPER